MSRPLVELRGVGKTYRGGTAALAPVDLEIGAGEFVAIVGPSGCGKSTLLRIIAGLVEASQGSRALGPGLDGRGRIGFVFQDPTLMPWATVADNIYLPLRLAGIARAAAVKPIEQAIAAVGLAGFEHAYPRQLSGGMRMRVSIARAFVTRPPLLLLDEPFAALDEITRFRLNDDLLRLWRDEGWTVIFVTHSVFEAVFLATRVMVMSSRPGRVAADLPIVFEQPRDSALRTSTEYAAACRAVSDQLAGALA